MFRLLNNIANLELKDENSWGELIDESSLYKLLYSLQIVDKLLQVESDWQNSFLVMRGFHHLFHVFLKINPAKVNSHLSFKSVDLLCKIICEAMEKHPDLMNYFKESSRIAIGKLLKLMHQVTDMSIDEIKKRGESYDDLYFKNNQCKQKNFRLLSYYDDKSKGEGEDEQNQYSRQIQALNTKFDQVGKFVSLSFRLLFYLEAYNNEECIDVLCTYPEIPQLLFSVMLETDNFYIRDQFTDGL